MNYKRHKIKKIIDSVNYIVSKNEGRVNYTKLIKLLYLADRKALIEWGFTITGDRYYALKNGPILSKTLDFVKGNAEPEIQAIWDEYFYTDQYSLIGEKTNRPNDSLSEIEIEILKEIDNQYKDFSFSDMIDIVHSQNVCPEWEDPGESSIPIKLEDILRKSGKADREIKNILEEYYSNEEDEEYLIENCQ
jgi:uncharacterized phage-associated protein